MCLFRNRFIEKDSFEIKPYNNGDKANYCEGSPALLPTDWLYVTHIQDTGLAYTVLPFTLFSGKKKKPWLAVVYYGYFSFFFK